MTAPVINKGTILILFASIVGLHPFCMNAQAPIPVPDLIINNLNITSGAQTFSNNSNIISSNDHTVVNFSNTSQINYIAGQSISLNDGFNASAYSGSGYFNAAIAPNDFSVAIIDRAGYYQENGEVWQFDKLEYGLDLPPLIDTLVKHYFGNKTIPGTINPFDPDDINIVATYISPSGTQNRTIYGFYEEDFSSDWTTRINTDYNFRLRFAPTEQGQWSCSISVNSPNGKFPSTYIANNLHFTCIEPAAGMFGYLQVGAHKRHLKFSGTGKSFFAIGQNIPWIQGFGNNFTASEFTTFGDHVRNISYSSTQNNGGNFVRIVMAPWSHAIEWENLGDYSDYTSYTSTAQNRQHNAYELDEIFEDCRTSGVYVNLDIELHSNYVSNPTGTDPCSSWEHNPYHTQLGLSNPTDVLTDANAKKYFKRRLRYMIARWGYSRNLAVIELLSEQDHWDNYAAATEDFYNWHSEMINYIRNILGEPNHLLSSSFSQRSGTVFALNSIDVTSTHSYSNAKDVNFNKRFDEMNEDDIFSATRGLLIDYNKPSIFGEFGMQDERGAQGPDLDGCNDYSFHNGLWSTAFMGCYGTGLEWWQEYNDPYKAANYPALAAFFNGIDFETNDFTFPGHWRDVEIPSRNNVLEVFQLHNFDRKKIMGWAHNATYYWGNEPSCTVLTANITDDKDDDYPDPQIILDKIEIHKAKVLKKYNIDWFDTRHASVSPFSTQTKWANIFGHLKPDYPMGGQADVAFKAYINGSTFRTDETEDVPSIDTLLCGEDTIQVSGTYEDDMNGTYQYRWNFGNGQVSSEQYPTIVYSNPGTYNVTLIVSDSAGILDTLSQQIVVLNCGGSNNSRNSTVNKVDGREVFKIYPNPNNGKFQVVLAANNDETKIQHIIIFDIRGSKVWETQNTSNVKFDIDISSQPKGIYYVQVIDSRGQMQVGKIINQ